MGLWLSETMLQPFPSSKRLAKIRPSTRLHAGFVPKDLTEDGMLLGGKHRKLRRAIDVLLPLIVVPPPNSVRRTTSFPAWRGRPAALLGCGCVPHVQEE